MLLPKTNLSIRPINEVAAKLGIDEGYLQFYGRDKAKIQLEARAASKRSPGKLILVSAMTPTSAGEGKTTMSIGLAQGLAKLGASVCLALRQPSLGPTFGLKGGATGGGQSVLYPAEDINLHFTGDLHAVTSAHNLLAAMLDNHIHFGLSPDIDPRHIEWRRVIDLNDRALRSVVIGLGGVLQGVPRETGFDISAASEIMATLCLAEDENDLRERLGRLIVAEDQAGDAVTAADMQAVGAMMVLLRDALLPNLVQTGEGVPAIVHGGPFANIAHGCNSVIATKMAMAYADWTVTEAGFGFALGAEKFFDIKCRSAGLTPATVVLVATVRALKRQGGVRKEDLDKPNPHAVERGLANLHKHIESTRLFGLVPVVALNRFASDTAAEIEVVQKDCAALNVPCAVSEAFEKGGDGSIDLARTVMEHVDRDGQSFETLYDLEEPVKSKMLKIATRMYGAREVQYTSRAEKDLAKIEHLGYSQLPLCVAKTPMSLSDDPRQIGRPEDFEITVREVLLSAGAGYIVPMLGSILRMPGLPRDPQASRMDLVDGKVKGLLGA